jgi:hypothetical protein
VCSPETNGQQTENSKIDHNSKEQTMSAINADDMMSLGKATKNKAMWFSIAGRRPMLNRKLFAAIFCLSAALFSGAQQARALTIRDTVGSSGKFLLTGSAVNTKGTAVLKIAFETTTAGNNLALCAGTIADFTAGTCTKILSGSGGPGFTFLTIVDAVTLDGLQLYVILEVGTGPACFSVTIE